MSRYIIPDSYLVAFNIGTEDYKYFKDYAIFFNKYETNNTVTKQRPKVLRSPEISELAWISMNAFITQYDMISKLQGSDGDMIDKIKEIAAQIGIDPNEFREPNTKEVIKNVCYIWFW